MPLKILRVCNCPNTKYHPEDQTVKGVLRQVYADFCDAKNALITQRMVVLLGVVSNGKDRSEIKQRVIDAKVPTGLIATYH